MKRISIFVVTLTIASLVLFGISVIAKSQSTSSSSTDSQVQFKPGPAVKAKAASPTPGPGAKQKTKKGTIGEDKVTITTRDSNNDFWIEQIDLDGKGEKSDAQMLWDNTEKMLFTYADKTLMCKDGSTADTNLLIAMYGTGNMAKKPVGSGWWAGSFDANECAMKTEGLYGCKFDQKGNNTACGVATLDEKTHELTITEAKTTENR